MNFRQLNKNELYEAANKIGLKKSDILDREQATVAELFFLKENQSNKKHANEKFIRTIGF